jgi:hypothetical protein
MLRLILLVVLLALAFVGGLAVVMHHYLGWKGLVAFPFLLVALLWGGKLIIGRMIKKFFLSLFSVKSVVLKGAAMTVHSITAIPMPPLPVDEEHAAIEEAGLDHDHDHDEEEEEPRHYFQVDVTIKPKGQERAWEPGEFMLASERINDLEDLQDDGKEVGNTHEVQIWNGEAFGPDEQGKYPGPQRLLLTFAVKPGISKAWLQYYDVPIGTLDLPPGKAMV